MEKHKSVRSGSSRGHTLAKPHVNHVHSSTVQKPTFVYSLNCKNGKKYVGKTNDIEKRLHRHFSGNGSKWTKKHEPLSVNHVQVCRTDATASKAEAIVYGKMRDYHGVDNVRGAGHTKST